MTVLVCENVALPMKHIRNGAASLILIPSVISARFRRHVSTIWLLSLDPGKVKGKCMNALEFYQNFNHIAQFLLDSFLVCRHLISKKNRDPQLFWRLSMHIRILVTDRQLRCTFLEMFWTMNWSKLRTFRRQASRSGNIKMILMNEVYFLRKRDWVCVQHFQWIHL